MCTRAVLCMPVDLCGPEPMDLVLKCPAGDVHSRDGHQESCRGSTAAADATAAATSQERCVRMQAVTALCWDTAAAAVFGRPGGGVICGHVCSEQEWHCLPNRSGQGVGTPQPARQLQSGVMSCCAVTVTRWLAALACVLLDATCMLHDSICTVYIKECTECARLAALARVLLQAACMLAASPATCLVSPPAQKDQQTTLNHQFSEVGVPFDN